MQLGPVFLYLLGVALYSAMDATMKHLVLLYPALVATFWRYATGTLFTALIWAFAGRRRISFAILPVHLARGLLIACSAFLFFWALAVLPLVEVVAISFVAPLLVPPIAALFLGEALDGRSIAAGVLGFVGIVVAAGFLPGAHHGRLQLLGVGAVFLSALLYAANLVLMRFRAARDGAAILSLFGTLVPALALLPFVVAFHGGQALVPAGAAMAFALAAGFLGAFALQFLAMAFEQWQAQLLAPFEYSSFLWAAFYGLVFFAEPVTFRVALGATMIGAACLWQAAARRPVL